MSLVPVVDGSKLLADYDGICAAVRKRNAKTVALQLPEGLRVFASEIAATIESAANVRVIIDSEPCFGACDIPVHLFGISDLVIQMGHTEMPSIGAIPKMYFANIFVSIDPIPVVEKALSYLKGIVGVVTTAQHMHYLDAIIAYINRSGIRAVYSRGDSRLGGYAQLLGCDYTSALGIEDSVDSFLYVGDGDFHPIGLVMLTDKSLICANPMDGTVRTIESIRDSIMKQRLLAVERAMKARSFGILVSSKLGQRRKQLAERLLKEIENSGRRASLIQTNVVTPELIGSYDFDAFASTVCPRVAIDDYSRYAKPILTPVEAEIAIGLKKFSEFRFDQILSEQ
ncbi:MAG: diphthamide biosynthesis enzyme Dph2 [Thermoplasmata archaeon]|jgi:2-(3-amino-3-carboxypropyl)histidine synthase|nr:diphthamide biosynthesis enzyme Dph2 [Candidatus Sysuiplasma jiujiangense]